ncbi:YecR family lipoprotein [Ottowia sp.]|uniref:YecR family lipoprotein n=1 Tax=Ottowia sp. TaxID=1898956 RepID=UPI001D2DA126|nr:YecR family lipoprotein [Ottowia sp.]MCB2038684.1 hypothetical protein [Ottowia sp.]MCP5256404.1 hypothetical protein [Burkholderiaceae bacterium]HPK31173.1 YecR family lipoprotein [Ottowia sp.]HRW72198.1 YecR family lipoprotein [Ottowia sp.]
MKVIAEWCFLAIVFTAITGCATPTEHARWVGVGGSKADGTVVLGIDVEPKMGVRETEIAWDIEQANAEADRRCRNWGYSRAEVFHNDFPVLKVCHPQGISPCWSKTYRVTYQCIDATPRSK